MWDGGLGTMVGGGGGDGGCMERHCCPASGVGDVVSPIPGIFPTFGWVWGERYGGER